MLLGGYEHPGTSRWCRVRPGGRTPRKSCSQVLCAGPACPGGHACAVRASGAAQCALVCVPTRGVPPACLTADLVIERSMSMGVVMLNIRMILETIGYMALRQQATMAQLCSEVIDLRRRVMDQRVTINELEDKGRRTDDSLSKSDARIKELEAKAIESEEMNKKKIRELEDIIAQLEEKSAKAVQELESMKSSIDETIETEADVGDSSTGGTGGIEDTGAKDITIVGLSFTDNNYAGVLHSMGEGEAFRSYPLAGSKCVLLQLGIPTSTGIIASVLYAMENGVSPVEITFYDLIYGFTCPLACGCAGEENAFLIPRVEQNSKLGVIKLPLIVSYYGVGNAIPADN
ncbi:hypothetical protein FNV43_RR16793 [Rhamnella rubrinervis]|uniref:Uncharacterized protein n=1 Tax=Rhamnella rubrinervis TaxID=2594499 RepID=A0A8K0GZI5_9ROSA|nr:hypothetical protein FNV43_RR16793 [Rhamnella rubrinervis]